MRDDCHPAREAVHEALEPVEAVEVEVVRRLVEQEQVIAREKDPGEGCPSRLAARERRRLLLQRDGEAELGADRPGACLQVGAPERQETLERCGVCVRPPVVRVLLDVRLGSGDAGAPRQVREQRLAGTALVLLRQIADRERDGGPLDASLVRLVETGGEPQQRRLADPVGADEAEPRARPDRQVDAVEDGVGAEGADDAVERDSHGTSWRT